jgi:hypothetical protein
MELVFDPRRSGQLADLSSLDNQSLSAMSLNQDSLFSTDENRAAKTELDSRTRQGFLQAFQQASKSSDPRAFSLGMIQKYQSMSSQERQAASLSPNFLVVAVKNYKSASSLISMLQSSGGSGSGPFDYLLG